jgi:hypothetical protein
MNTTITAILSDTYPAYYFRNYTFDSTKISTDTENLNAFADGMRKHLYGTFELCADDTCVQLVLDDYMERDFDWQFDEIGDPETIESVSWRDPLNITIEDIDRAINERVEKDLPTVTAFFRTIPELVA